MTQNQMSRYANSPHQWYDFVLPLAMELAWGDSENVYEILSVRRSNTEYFRNLNGGV